MTADDPKLDTLLRSYAVPPLGADATARLLQAAAPLLAVYATQPNWPSVARAIVVALLALPTVLAFDAVLLQGVYRLLAIVLPASVSLALTLQYGALLLLLLGATFVLIPVVAGHASARAEELHV